MRTDDKRVCILFCVDHYTAGCSSHFITCTVYRWDRTFFRRTTSTTYVAEAILRQQKRKRATNKPKPPRLVFPSMTAS